MSRQNRTDTVDPETRRTLNDLARHKMILNLYNDIMVDLTICEIEGWDKMEYIKDLQEVINHFGREQKLQERDSRYYSADIRKIQSISDIQRLV